MIDTAHLLISDFDDSLARAGKGRPKTEIVHESQLAPHKAHSLPASKCAVYVFSLSETWGKKCPAGPKYVLKVGKVGPNSSPRFQYQHYNPNSAGSTVARSLLNSKILWPHLGLTKLTEEHVADWIRHNTDRDHFYLDAADKAFLDDLERYLRGLLGSAFEGG